ncbi:S-layer homology domain-containing protein [Clostridiaceae bacterium M8S5]|nr:S-layer homology domain-containing protein [Clostridiaceae bacterium M8S5]
MKKAIYTILIVLLFTQTILAVGFSDIKEDHWAREAVEKLVIEEIVNGYPDNTFKPNNSVTRSEFSKLIQEVLKLKIDTSEEVIFKDIKGTWAEGRIKALVRAEIIDTEDYKDGFKPNEPITRVEMSKMVVKALKLEIKDIDKTDFTDDDKIKQKDKKYIVSAQNAEIIKGYPDGSFKPNNTATRAETAVMILRMINYQKKDGVEIVSGIRFDRKNDVIVSDTQDTNQAMKIDKQQEFVMKFFETLKFTKEGSHSYVSGCLPEVPEGYRWSCAIEIFYKDDTFESFYSDDGTGGRKEILFKTNENFKFKLKHNKNKIEKISVSINIVTNKGAEFGLFKLKYPLRTLYKYAVKNSVYISDGVNWEEMIKW